jgi:ankyrin repeat protein/beta-lactamase regulating signal transducer with metallopeptidase domain
LQAEIPTQADVTFMPAAEEPAVSVSVPAARDRITSLTMRQWLAIGWIAGLSIFALVALIKAWRTVSWLRRERKPLPAELHSSIEGLFRDFGGLPKLWLVDGIGQPFVWGLLCGSIYLPADFVKIVGAECRKSVLGHELCHILRFDAGVNLLQVIAQAIFWFHPFVWWANKKIRAEREKCCDEMAIARLGAKAKEYSSAIVNILISEQESTRPIPSLAVAGPVKNIEERIKTMLRPGKTFYKRPSLVTATFTLLLGLLTVPTSLVLTALGQTEPPPQRKAEITQSIYFAASEGDIEQVRLHISNGSDVNKKDTTGDTALHYAVRYGREDVVKLLITNGARVNEKNADGNTSLHYAVMYTHKNLAELLISAGADVSAKNNDGDLPIQLSANEGVLDLLIAKGPIPSSMQMAAYQGDIAKVKRFLEQGISVDSRDSGGRTALHYAALHGKRAVVEFLLNQGADVNAKDKGWGSIRWGFTPLKHASSSGHKDVVELLIAKGANVDAMDKYGWTALDSAVYGRKDIAEMLIKAGANVNSRYWWGETPLIWAAHAGQADIADLLIANGAEIDARDYYGRTALYHAAWRGFRDVAELLISKGANVNIRDDQGRSPLWIAENTGPKQIAKMLRMHRDDGWDKATSADEHKKIAELLRQHGAKE